ncbi:hypothetical protein F5Y17DRAFT_448476 [Xylariaceae sp. FL0594]|nr:hypothetical protein F5Y17DRAFT_448476 [Xylariaceae sp. FL0594]
MASDWTYLDDKDSQEPFISLQQLDPSPIDTPDREFSASPEDALASPTSTSSSPLSRSASSLGLSGHGHGPIFYLTRIQRYSSYTFTFFAGLHLTNTSLIPMLYRSVPYSEPFLLMTRELYQTSVTEPLLVGLPVLAHVASGVAIRLIRRHQNMKRYYGDATPGVFMSLFSQSASISSPSTSASARIWPTFTNIAASGYVFTALLSAHVAMNRVLPLVADGDSSNIGLGYVAHGFARHPFSAWASYVLLLSVGAGHMVWGLAKWLDLAPPAKWKHITFDKKLRKHRRRAWWAVNASAASLAVIWAVGGLGVVARGGLAYGWLGTVYDKIYSYAGMAS